MPYKGVWPKVAGSALVLPGAAVVGDVELGPDSSVWFNAVVRGDDGPIRIGRESNVQDGCVVHVAAGLPTVVGDRVTLGHNVHLHACRLHDETLIGSSATVLDGAVIERGAQVAAGATVTPNATIGAGELWGGVPARKLRDLDDEEIAAIRRNAEWYVRKLNDYRRSMEETA